jgi:chemotaxis protein methyltransferase CheR
MGRQPGRVVMERVSSNDFDFVRNLVYEHSAITLDDTKEYLVEARLAPVARREGLPSIAELIRLLRAGAPRLRDDVVAAVATNETTFFRDVHPFDALRDVVIPDLLARNGSSGLNMWSAAASTGQEAYSMALVVREHFPSVPAVRIVGTDVAADVLDRARAGRFSQLEINRGLPARLLVRHFRRDGTSWVLADDIRRMVTFRRMNLAQPFDAITPMDVIFLRNVLIYFDMPTKVAVLRRIAQVLRPGGYLLLGGSESTYGFDPAFERVQIGRSMFYRLAQGKESR